MNFVGLVSHQNNGSGLYLLPTSLTKVSHRSRRTLPTAPPTEPRIDESRSPISPATSHQDLYSSHLFLNTIGQHSARATSQSPNHLPITHNQSSISTHPSQSMRPQPILSPYQAQAVPRVQPVYSPPEQRDQQMPHTEPSLMSSESKPIQGSPRESPSIQNGVTSVSKGKPRIFAAMEALEAQENKRPQQPFINDPLYPPLSIHDFPTQGSHHMRIARAEEVSTPKLHYETLPLLFPSSSAQVKDQFASPNGLKPIPSQFPISAHDRIPAQVHSRSLSNTRSTGRQDDLPRPSVPQTPPRTKKLSKARHPSDVTAQAYHMNGSVGTLPGTPDGQNKLHLGVSKNNLGQPANDFEPVVQLDDETIRKAGIPLDDDPFARVEGVRMLRPSSSPKNVRKEKGDVADRVQSATTQQRENGSPMQPNSVLSDSLHPFRKDKKGKDKSLFFQHEPVTATRLLFDAQVFPCLLQFLSFYEWCNLLALSKEIRLTIVRTPALREAALERFLKTIGYSRWIWDDQEPLSLSLQVSYSPVEWIVVFIFLTMSQDLSDYMRGVSTPTHECARAATSYIQSLRIHPNHRDPLLGETVHRLTTSTRAYNRVLLRLRAQAEKEPSIQSAPPTSFGQGGRNFTSTTRGGNSSRTSSRAPSPTTLYSSSPGNGYLPGVMQASISQTSLAFKSPLFRLRRAPLLRVFVPSPEDNWLSDRSVLECEAEVKRAGVQHLLRMGDVVWDVAVGDEGNSGRLVWNGSYLIVSLHLLWSSQLLLGLISNFFRT